MKNENLLYNILIYLNFIPAYDSKIFRLVQEISNPEKECILILNDEDAIISKDLSFFEFEDGYNIVFSYYEHNIDECDGVVIYEKNNQYYKSMYNYQTGKFYTASPLEYCL